MLTRCTLFQTYWRFSAMGSKLKTVLRTEKLSCIILFRMLAMKPQLFNLKFQ